MSRLKKELELSRDQNSELTSALAIERSAREKEVLAELESRGTMAEKELVALQAKCDAWLAELVEITKELGRKCFLAFISFPC